MKNKIFETKEQYLQFKSQWATYFNETARKVERDEYGHKIKKLTPEHFIIYATICGKNPNDCIQTCSDDTYHSIEWYLKTPSYISREPFAEFISAEQMEVICTKALDLIDDYRADEMKLKRMGAL